MGKSKRRYNEHTILHWSNEITYNLWAKNGEIPSAHYSALIKRDHVLPVGEKQRDSVSTRFRINPTRSARTSCGWKTGRSHEHRILHQLNEITYSLWEWYTHALPSSDKINSSCMCNTSSNPQVIFPHPSDEITYNLWAQPDDAWWTRSFVSIPRNDIRAMSRKTGRDHEHGIFYLSDDLTYFLLAKKQGDTISISLVIYLFTSHTFCRRKAPVMMSTSIPT